MFYEIVENKLYRWGDYRFSEYSKELTNETMDSFNNDRDKYILCDDELIINPQYDVIIKQREKKQRVEELKKELDKLDLKSIRAIRANDIEYINKYEAEAETLREEIRKLEN